MLIIITKSIVSNIKRGIMNKNIIIFLSIIIFLICSFTNYAREKSFVLIHPLNNKTQIENLSQSYVKFTPPENTENNYYEFKRKTGLFYKKTLLKFKSSKNDDLEIIFTAPTYNQRLKAYDVTSKFKALKIYVNDDPVIDNTKSFITDKATPLTYQISVKKGDVVQITYKVKTHLKKSDINNYTRGFILIALLLCLMLIPYFSKNDFIDKIVEKYKDIEPIYIKTFWAVLITLLSVFSINILHLFFGNHDWGYFINGYNLNTYLSMGRYSSELIKNILFDGHYVPILSYLVGFTGFSLLTVLLNIYWKTPKKLYIFIICGLLLTIQPFTLEWTFYLSSIPEFFLAPLCVILALMLAEKSVQYFKKQLIFKFAFINLTAIILLNFSLSVYPPLINTIAVVFIGKLFIEFLNWHGDKTYFKNIIYTYIPTVFDILTAGIIYRIIVWWLKISGILRDFYTINPIALSDLPLRIYECIKVAFVQIFRYQAPFMPNYISELFAFLLIMLVITLLFKNNSEIKTKNIAIKLIQLLTLVFVLIATKVSTMLCADTTFMEPRIDFYGLVYFRVLIVIALFTIVNRDLLLKNITAAITSIIIFTSIVNDLLAQKIWLTALEAEKMLWNRMITRIEDNDNFDFSKNYTFILIGNNCSLREKYYKPGLKSLRSMGLYNHPFNAAWVPFEAQEFYYPRNFINAKYYYVQSERIGTTLKDSNDENLKKKISEMYNTGILQNMKEWPAKESVFIYDDIIIFVNQQRALNEFLSEIENGELL